MSWPLSQDYNEAIQDPLHNFSDAELRTGEAATNALGIPMPRSGNFADVYELRSRRGGHWAVKCFTREVPGLRERYAAISRHLKDANLPFIVDFTFLEQGIRVGSRWYPVLKMQWVEGLTLNEFVRQYADKPAMLQNLLQIWVRMAIRLREAGIAHADLQHGNVLLVPGSTGNSLAVKLVDYDGMWVPALAGGNSGEVGHPCYQHPQRLTERIYSLEVDRFPLLMVATALDGLRVGGRALWDKYDSGDNLLFREADLQAPVKSRLFYELLKLGDARASRLASQTLDALKGRLEAVPLLEELLPELYAPPASKPAAPATPKRATIQATAAELAAAVQAAVEATPTSSAWEDLEGKDKTSSRRRRQGSPLRWVGCAAGVGVAGLIVAGVVVGLGLRYEPEKPDDTATIAQKKSSKHPSPRNRQSQKTASPAPGMTSFLTDQEHLEPPRHMIDPNTGGGFSLDGTIGGRNFTVEGKESPHGIFIHPSGNDYSEISYRLDRHWAKFLSGVAVPRMGEMSEERGLCLGGKLLFEVVGDEEVLWTSEPVRDFDQPQWCEVNVKNVEVLRLRVRCPGVNWCARAVWIEPRLTTSKGTAAPKDG